MNGHESIRAKLAIAASGALGQEEWLQVEKHTRECQECRRELEVWTLYAREMRHLPQPVFPQDLLARTQARVLIANENRMASRRNSWVLFGLAGYSWVLAISVWMVARALTGGTLEVFGTNWVAAGPWILISGLLSWITAGAAAVTLGTRHPARRVL
jgi:hypothetical protein